MIYFSLDEFPHENREIAVNNELEKVNTWLKLNKLSINVNKTKCMFSINAVILLHYNFQ